jgi:hypothetical protein
MLTASKYTYIVSKATEVHTSHRAKRIYLSLNTSLWNNLAMALGEFMNLHALPTRCTSSVGPGNNSLTLVSSRFHKKYLLRVSTDIHFYVMNVLIDCKKKKEKTSLSL